MTGLPHKELEVIVGVACVLDGVVWAMPKPNRHHHVLHMLDAAGLEAIRCYDIHQGFITNKNRFLTRAEAAILAIQNGQANPDKMYNKARCYSEDLW